MTTAKSNSIGIVYESTDISPLSFVKIFFRFAKRYTVANLSTTKTLKIFDTEKETSVNLTIDTSFNFVNIYYGRFENSPVKIASIDINNFNVGTSEIIRFIGANDKMVLSYERISETNLKISVTEKLTEGVDSFKYIRVELSKI